MKRAAPVRSRKAPGLLALWACLFFAACGTADKIYDGDDDEPSTDTPSKMSSDPSQKLTSIPVSFTNGSGSGFALTATAVDAYEIQLTDCLSGYTATVTEADAEGLKVYSFDRGCRAKLTTFTVNGRQYFPTAGDPFTTWQDGDTAVFDETGEPGNFPLNLVVESTLSDPVTGNETIAFGIYNLLSGGDKKVLGTTVGASAALNNGSDAPPSFTIKSVEFVGLSETGAGKYKLLLECTASIGITNICETVNFTDLDYKLVKDIWSSAPDLAQADGIFATNGSSVTLPDDRVAPGDQGIAKGGVFTTVLEGPGPLLTNYEMIFILRSFGAGGSYQYFNIDVSITSTY